MSHVILLGDSIFDNARYVPGRPAVIEQVRTRLTRGWCATLLAVDGAVAEDVKLQIQKMPGDASHIVMSVGGNNALGYSRLLHSDSIASEMFERLADAQSEFQGEYRATLQAVVALGMPTAVCTVYDSIPGLAKSERAALSLFNDVIIREAIRHKVPVIDLRFVCDEFRDYSEFSPIEPSEVGGAKISQAICRLVVSHDFEKAHCVAYRN